MNSIPLPLRQAMESGECVLFLGAGIGQHIVGGDGLPLPSGSELAQELAQKHGIALGAAFPDLAKIAQIVEQRKGRAELDGHIQKKFSNVTPDKTFQWIASQRWRAIFTTNYDNGIERAYSLSSGNTQNPISISATTQMQQPDFRCEVPIYHLHGAAFDPSSPRCVITAADYTVFGEKRKMLFEVLKREFATSTILYVGYSNQDPNWSQMLSEIEREFYPAKLPSAFQIDPNINQIDSEILDGRGIKNLPVTFSDFVTIASRELAQAKADSAKFSRLKETVPSDLFDFYERNQAPIVRLLGSWHYVNQAPFSARSNISQFLKGDKATWSTIANKEYFQRDIEEQIYDQILDYITGTAKRPMSVAVLGPAGYGTSTLLMSIAARLVKDNAAKVFYHNTVSPLNEGDIRYAASLFPGIPVFVIDDAADNSANLQTTIELLSAEGRPALFLLGERLNEWRQTHKKLRAKECILEPLSDSEINRVLDFLAAQKALGVLENVPRDLQFSAIKNNFNKELLVAMREATEGKGFDAILEGEFRGINTDLARKMYLMVCCFYQYGIVVRDSLLAELMGIPLTELYEQTRDATDGVVIFDSFDGSDGRYYARARHRTIAQIVWERCGYQSEKGPMIQAAMTGLNISYKPDRDAYDEFVRADHLVDSLSSLDEKSKYFETACKKDPTNPYVRQHFARMLSRSQRPTLALSQIEEALKLAPRARILYHTKGTILAQLAKESDSLEIARKRMAQGEEAFKIGLANSPNDEYCHHGLASLYFDWAQKAPNSEEQAEYLAKAEDVISKGLKVVFRKEPLWLISAEISDRIGNSDGNLAALERAVAANPSSVISRYLLGRAHRRKGNSQKTIEVLHPILKDHADQFRAYLEYALAMRDLNKPLKEIIGILEMGRVYGLSDPQYISTLGGFLFLNRNFDKSKDVFSEADKREFAGDERLRVFFQDKTVYRGNVLAVRHGHAWIQASDLPRIYCPSRFTHFYIKTGQQVQFQLGFNCYGPLAYKVDAVAQA